MLNFSEIRIDTFLFCLPSVYFMGKVVLKHDYKEPKNIVVSYIFFLIDMIYLTWYF